MPFHGRIKMSVRIAEPSFWNPPMDEEDDDDSGIVVSFSQGKLMMSGDGFATEVEELAVPTVETLVRFGIPILTNMLCTWKLVENRNGDLCLHWTIAKDLDDNHFDLPKELRLTVLGKPKMSSKGYKYEVPISGYEYDQQNLKLEFCASHELLPFYIITAFMENCLQPWHMVIALLKRHHPRHEVRVVREVRDVLDEDDVFTDDADFLCIAPRLDISPLAYQGPIDSRCPF